MRPIKNRMFCLECKRPKMLFESKGKALNFIKFNSDEIKDANGIAPTRVYYCKSCGGWHVTSRVRPVSERKQIRNWIGFEYGGDKHSFGSNCKNQYENVSEVFLGELLGMWKSGMQLRIAERVEKSYKYIYYKYTGFDYWIKLAGRNVHFYLGRPFRYTCIVSSTPLDASQAFHLFRESI